MVEAATEFRKNSFNDSDSATLAKVATMFTNVADESMSAADSASFIIAQMKAFNIEADDAYRIIDSVNAVSNNYAVSSGQLAQNLGNMSAAMATGNNTFEQSLGMLTAMTEITRNAAKGSRALITVQGRLNQVVDESSDTGKALTAWYQEHAIAIKDDEGQVRSLYEVLTDVAKIWPKLTKNEQMYYLQQQAGTTQTQNLAALLKNYQTAIDATNTALESNGSAMKENEAYMESISAKEQALAAEFEDFANRVLSKELVGGFLDAGKAMLDFANNDVGAAITRITGFSAAIASLVGIAGTVIGKLSEMRTLFSATNAAGGLASILTSPKTLLIIAGVAAAIAGIVEVVQALNQAAENRKFENLVKNFEELDEQAKDAADKLEDVKKRLDELNGTPAKDRGQDWQNEIDKLETLKQYYEYIEQMRQNQAAEAQEAAYNAPRTVGVSVDKKVVETDEYSNDFQTYIKEIGQYKTEQEAVYALAAQENISFTNEQTEALSKLSDETEIAAQGYAYLKQNLEAIGYTFSNNIQTASEYALSQGSAMKGLAVQIEETKKYSTELTQAQQEQYDAYIKNNQGQYEYLSGLSNLTTEQQAFVDGYKAMVDAMGDYSIRVQNTSNALQETANAFSTYDEILTNYQNAMNGVAGASDEFVASLYDQNGQLTEAAQTLLTGSQQMWSFANAEAAANTAAAQANLNNLIEQLAEVGNTAALSAQQITLMFAAAGLSASVQATYGDIANDKRAQMAFAAREFQEGDNLQSYLLRVTKENLEKAQKEQEQLQDIGKDKGWIGSGGGSSGKSAEEKAAEEAEKQAKKAQKAQEKAAKESQQAYESAAKSAEQAAQEAARAAEQAAEEAKQKILDSIQELKDASDDFWDSKTDAIEETNKELDRQKQLEEKLKALEEARQKKILLYKNGQFQYDKDYGTIAKAQADYEETRDKIQRERELEQLQEMKDNATEIFNEMKDIVQNGGNVTQEMINSWLSQMQADGADYYDSNKQMLSEWLDWAKGAINEISNQVASATGGGGGASGGYGSGGGSVSGQWSHQDETNPYVAFGQDTIQEMLEWIKKIDKYQDDEEFMNEIIRRAANAGYIIPSNAGLRGNLKMNLLEALQKILAPYQNLIETNTSSPYVYAWKGLFKGELQRGTDLGSNTVFAGYQNKLLSGSIDDPYEEQEYYQRNQAIKALYNEYKKITDQLGYIPDYLKDFMEMGSQMLSNVDIVARQMADNYDNLSASGKSLLDSLISGEEDYEAANKMRIAYLAENYSPERLRYMNLVRVAGSSRNAMQLMNQRTEEDKARDEALYGDWLNELRDKIDEAGGVVTDEIYKWYLKTAGGALGAKGTGDAQLYTDVFAGGGKYLYSDQEELERLGYHGFLGNFGNISEGGLSDVTKNLVKSKILTSTTETNIDKQKEQITQNNIKGIKDTLEKYQEGYGATQHWIDDASKYITDTLNKNNEALLTADAETRKSLLAQNDELMGIRDSLSGVEADEDVSKLPGSTTAYNDWEFKIENPTDEELAAKAEQRAQKLADQMAANSEAWWNASSKAEQDALHKANEELAKQINDLTGSNLTYEGHSGTWSKNASGTHNFRGGLSLVGERGPELRVLGQGDNVIPAYQTANLWKWSGTTPESMLKTLELRKGNGCSSYTFNVSKLELPNVNNAKEFVAGLKNYALQYSYRR